jgi:hypothetical protein
MINRKNKLNKGTVSEVPICQISKHFSNSLVIVLLMKGEDSFRSPYLSYILTVGVQFFFYLITLKDTHHSR